MRVLNDCATYGGGGGRSRRGAGRELCCDFERSTSQRQGSLFFVLCFLASSHDMQASRVLFEKPLFDWRCVEVRGVGMVWRHLR